MTIEVGASIIASAAWKNLVGGFKGGDYFGIRPLVLEDT